MKHEKFCSQLSAYCHILGVTIDGFELVNGFIDHLYTPLGITINYGAIAKCSHFTDHYTLNLLHLAM
jgi:hypothetical protein